MLATSKTAFKAVTKAKHCPVCDGDHKCSVGEDGLILCGRKSGPVPGFVFLGKSAKDEQWSCYRREGDPLLERDRPRTLPGSNGKHEANGQAIDWNAKATAFTNHLTTELRDELAETLGLPTTALDALPIGFNPADLHGPCWTFPEVDHQGTVIGISRRYRNGDKKAMQGAGRGLTIPHGWKEMDGPLLGSEGPSDVLTGVAVNLAVIGRPSNSGGVEYLAALFKDVPRSKQIIILGENDTKANGSWPGLAGAKKVAQGLADRLERTIAWALPPDRAKDLRSWVLAQHPDRTCLDQWQDLGAEFVSRLEPQEVGPKGESKALHEVSAIELAMSDEPDHLEYLPLLGQDGFIVKGWSHLVAGYPRCGKTELLVACVRDWLTKGYRVVYFTEEPPSIWRYRLARAREAWSGMQLVFALGEEPGRLLERAVGGPEEIVVVDSCRNLGLLGPDENDNSKVSQALGPWVAQTRNAHKTFVAAHHDRKGQGSHGEGIAGGHAILALVDIGLEVLHDNAPSRRVIRTYARLIQTPDFVYERREDGTLAGLGSPESLTLAEVRERVLEVMNDTEEGAELTTKDVHDQLDPKPSGEQVRQALKEEAKAGTIERIPPITEGDVRGKRVRWRRPKST